MNIRGAWAICYNDNKGESTLKSLYTGFYNDAIEKAKELTKRDGVEYFVKNGNATYDAFSRD